MLRGNQLMENKPLENGLDNCHLTRTGSSGIFLWEIQGKLRISRRYLGMTEILLKKTSILK